MYISFVNKQVKLKLSCFRLFDESSKYTSSMYDQLLPNKAAFKKLNFSDPNVKIPKYQLTRDMLQCCSGLMVDFLNQLKQDLDFHYHLYIVDKNKPGNAAIKLGPENFSQWVLFCLKNIIASSACVYQHKSWLSCNNCARSLHC